MRRSAPWLRLGASKHVLYLLCAMYLITYVDRVNIATAASSIQSEFHLSNKMLGLAFSGFGYSYLVMQIAGGWIADRLGAHKTLVLSGLVWAGATLLTGATTGLISLLIARVVLGIGEGATFPSATRAMGHWTPAAQRGYAQGLTHAFARIGNALAPPLLVALMAVAGWRGAFIALGFVSLVWTARWGIYFRDDPRAHGGCTPEELDALPEYRITAGRRGPLPWGALARRMMPVTAVYFCYGWTLWLYLNWLPSFFLHVFGLDLKSSALFSAGVFFAGVLGDTAGGHLSDAILRRTGSRVLARSRLVCAGMALSLVSLVPVLFVHRVPVIAFFLSLAFFFLEVTIGPMWAIPMDIAPRHSGTASGLMNTGSAAASIVSPLLFGALIDWTHNWTLPFSGSVAMLALGAVLSYFMHPERAMAE